jgi:hypothetical protein
MLESGAELRAGPPARIDQVVAVHGELVEPVRPPQLALEALAEAVDGDHLRLRLRVVLLALPEQVRPLVGDELERELVAVTVQEPPGLRR